MSVYSKNNLIERKTFGEQIGGHIAEIQTSTSSEVHTLDLAADDIIRNYIREEAFEVLFSGDCSLTGVNGDMELRNNPQCFQAICSVTNSSNCFTNFNYNYSLTGNADGFAVSTATGGSDLMGSQTFSNLNPIGCTLRNDMFDFHGGVNSMELSNFDQCSFSVCAVTDSDKCWDNFF